MELVHRVKLKAEKRLHTVDERSEQVIQVLHGAPTFSEAVVMWKTREDFYGMARLGAGAAGCPKPDGKGHPGASWIPSAFRFILFISLHVSPCGGFLK